MSDEMSAVVERVRALKNLYAARDVEAGLLRAVLSGKWEEVAPGAFTEDYPAPMVANRIEVQNRLMSAALSALPSISCGATNAMSEAAKKRAENRTRIANSYIEGSNLEAHMTDFATGYQSFGMGVFFIEPDFDAKMPRIRVVDSSQVYAQWGPDGYATRAAEEYVLPAMALCDSFPNAEPVLKQAGYQGEQNVTVIRYSDKKRTVVYLPEVSNHVLTEYRSPIPGRSQYVATPRVGSAANSFTGVPRGAYYDLIFPQMADHEFRMLMLEAASKSIQAPIAVPPDVTDIPYGPDAVIRTQSPQNVRRIDLNVPNQAFAASELIRQDLGVGGMSPEAMTGNIDASVITGKGVEALQGGYSSQIANAQTMIAFALRQAIECCFLMDEHLWGKRKKKIRGTDQGAPFELDYTPGKDIAGEITVDITYGFLAGMAPNNALVFVLQAQAAGLISRDFAARQLPVGMNVNEEFHKIDLETLRNSLMQGMSALSQAIPGMVMQGQDPTQIIGGLAEVANGIKKGKQLEEIVADVFAPKPPPAPAPGSEDAAAAAGAPGDGAGGGPLSPGDASIATEGPNARPDLMQMFAGIGASGEAALQGGISRMDPVQGQ